MDEVGLALCFVGVFITGLAVGHTVTTNDVPQKVIAQATKACENSEGLYKINKGSGRDSTKAFCKNNDKFDLKDVE